MKITTLPYKVPRKSRRQEALRFCVKYGVGNTVQFRWYRRDTAAVKFLNTLVESGIPATILMK
jgi:hypothetical protein